MNSTATRGTLGEKRAYVGVSKIRRVLCIPTVNMYRVSYTSQLCLSAHVRRRRVAALSTLCSLIRSRPLHDARRWTE